MANITAYDVAYYSISAVVAFTVANVTFAFLSLVLWSWLAAFLAFLAACVVNDLPSVELAKCVGANYLSRGLLALAAKVRPSTT